MERGPDFASQLADGARPVDLLVAGDAVPDVIVGDVGEPIAFGQAETLVERGVLTVGGSSAIMACGAARLGLRVAFVGVFGDDAASRFMLRELSARGIDVSGCVVLPERATGLTVHLVRSGVERDRAMLTSSGCVGELTVAMVRRVLGKGARHLHVGSFYLLPKLAPGLAGLFAEARQAGCTTSLDTQGDWAGRWQGGLREVLGETDLYFPNQDEARAAAASLDPDSRIGDDGERLLRALAERGPLPVMKRGADGALTLAGEAVIGASALRVAPVDTIGAGDSFDAGFVYGHLQGWPVKSTLAFAVACGSLSTRASGGVDAQPSAGEALAASATVVAGDGASEDGPAQ
ncbi:MAG: carbohydrate kinase family protein [Thermoleophilia bacterium]